MCVTLDLDLFAIRCMHPLICLKFIPIFYIHTLLHKYTFTYAIDVDTYMSWELFLDKIFSEFGGRKWICMF